MEAFLIYIFKSAVFIAIFYICFKLLLSKETFFRLNRFILLIGTSICLILPTITISVPDSSPIYQPLVIIEKNILINDLTTQDINTTNNEPSELILADTEKSIISIQTILLSIYPVGFIANLFLLIKSAYSIYRLTRKRKRIKYKTYNLIIIPENISAFTWGNYIIISEEDYKNHPLEILTHEIAHTRLYHYLDILFIEIIVLLQWFNPFIWLLKKEIKNNHEYQADMRVLQSGIDATKYQLLLVEKAVGTCMYTLANGFNQSKIKKRIFMMLKEKSNKLSWLKSLLILPAISLAMYAFAQPEIKSVEQNAVEIENKTAYYFPLKKIKSITLQYGEIANRKRVHNGIDMRGMGKDTIYAFTSGVVNMSDFNRAWGNIITINHKDGLNSLYAHNSKNLVEKGEYVQAGQPIAIIGSTGRSTGEHLHFEIRKDDIHIDPMNFFEEGLDKDTFIFKEDENLKRH